MFPFFGEPPTEEQIAEAEKARARGEAQVASVRRMFAEELSMDQLEHVYQMLYMITNSASPAAIAEWWEGVVWGVKATREIRLGELTTAELEDLEK